MSGLYRPFDLRSEREAEHRRALAQRRAEESARGGDFIRQDVRITRHLTSIAHVARREAEAGIVGPATIGCAFIAYGRGLGIQAEQREKEDR